MGLLQPHSEQVLRLKGLREEQCLAFLSGDQKLLTWTPTAHIVFSIPARSVLLAGRSGGLAQEGRQQHKVNVVQKKHTLGNAAKPLSSWRWDTKTFKNPHIGGYITAWISPWNAGSITSSRRNFLVLYNSELNARWLCPVDSGDAVRSSVVAGTENMTLLDLEIKHT